jgi:hypothetical protein
MKKKNKNQIVKVPANATPAAKSLAATAQRIISNTIYNNLARKQNGPVLVEMAQGDGSLRELSRKAKVSVTYLSLVRNGEMKISMDVYLSLLSIIFRGEKDER